LEPGASDADGQVNLRNVVRDNRCDEAVAPESELDELEQAGLPDAGVAGPTR
jgi:hypothetical protein